MAEEHNSGGSGHVEGMLTENQRMIKEEVARALEAALPTYIEEIKSSLKDFLHEELADFKAGAEVEQPSKKMSNWLPNWR
ncbi:hypothetical protein E3N88_24843 [Mikania micrantha]|uniref:Uncharacterized protein n=1 Tax=Mikania micrantha TaxID=192012 RepID=A0A5N6N328_9ASTR|nr:hypothetical protein E3N88_24843 [Mikania micrantha]